MTNEQREAIEYLKESVLIYKNTIPKMSNAIDTVLSLTNEQDKYIKDANDITTEMSNDIKKLTSELNKKDKIITEMIEEYEYNDGINTKKFCDEEIRKDKCIKNCTICMQEYFAGLVEKE